MDIGEFRPGDRNHLGGCVELHRAGAERDHAAVERQIAIGKAPHIAKHLGFGPVAVEHRLLHETAIAAQLVRKAGSGVALRRGAERAEQSVEHVGRACLVKACGDGAIHAAKVEAGFQCGRDKPVAVIGCFDGDGVEELLMAHAATGGAHRRGKPAGQAVRVTGDPCQPFRTMPQGVETGHHSQKHLCRADVRGRLFAADMLLAGLQGKTVGHAAGAVLADADKPSRD